MISQFPTSLSNNLISYVIVQTVHALWEWFVWHFTIIQLFTFLINCVYPNERCVQNLLGLLVSCECKSTQCRSQSITDATQSAFLNFPRCSTFPRFLSHNVNVNIIVCSCSFFLLQIPNILMLITAGRILTMSMSPTLHQCWCLKQPDLASVNAFHCAGSKNCKMSSTPQLMLFVPWPPILSSTLTQVLLRNTVTAKENVTGPFLNCQIPVFQRLAFL